MKGFNVEQTKSFFRFPETNVAFWEERICAEISVLHENISIETNGSGALFVLNKAKSSTKKETQTCMQLSSFHGHFYVQI